jgi:hypothetical protein
MVIKSDGKVGIGTDNPLGKAHIYVDDAASSTQLFIENVSTSNRAGLVLRNGDGEDFKIQHTSGSSNAAIIQNSSTVNGGIKFYAKGDGEYQFRTTDSNTLRMVIENDGKVGIGTGSPASLCDLSLASGTNYSNTVALTIRNYSSDYTQIANGFGSRIQFKTNRGTGGSVIVPSADIKGYVYSGAGGTTDYHALDLDVYGDNASLNKGISILSTSNSGGPADTIMHGDVGIGTVSPDGKLDIYTGSTGTVALSFDRYSSGNYRTDIYQNSYGPDFRVGYDTYTPESVLYLKRLSDGTKEVEITGNVFVNGYITSNMVAFHAYNNSGGNTSSTSDFPANVEVYDYGGCYNTTNYTFIAPVNGLYHFWWFAFTNTDAATASRWFFVKNGSNYAQNGSTIQQGGQSYSVDAYMTAGDSMKLSTSSAYGIYWYGSQSHNGWGGHLVMPV